MEDASLSHSGENSQDTEESEPGLPVELCEQPSTAESNLPLWCRIEGKWIDLGKLNLNERYVHEVPPDLYSVQRGESDFQCMAARKDAVSVVYLKPSKVDGVYFYPERVFIAELPPEYLSLPCLVRKIMKARRESYSEVMKLKSEI